MRNEKTPREATFFSATAATFFSADWEPGGLLPPAADLDTGWAAASIHLRFGFGLSGSLPHIRAKAFRPGSLLHHHYTRGELGRIISRRLLFCQ